MKKFISLCIVIVLALLLVSCGGGDENNEQTWRISYLDGDTIFIDGDCFFVESMAVGLRVVCENAEGDKIFDGVVASYQPFR